MNAFSREKVPAGADLSSARQGLSRVSGHSDALP